MSSEDQNHRRTKRITVSVTPALHDALTEAAQWKDQALGDFVHESMLQVLIEMGVVPCLPPRRGVVRQGADDPKGKPGVTSHLHS